MPENEHERRYFELGMMANGNPVDSPRTVIVWAHEAIRRQNEGLEAQAAEIEQLKKRLSGGDLVEKATIAIAAAYVSAGKPQDEIPGLSYSLAKKLATEAGYGPRQ